VVVDGSGVGQNEGRVWVCYVSDSHVSRVAKRREGFREILIFCDCLLRSLSSISRVFYHS